MDLDTRSLLAHVVHNTPDHCASVIDGQRRSALDLAHVVEIIRPLLAVLELKGYDSVLSVLPFRLLSYAESLAYFGVNL
jgi:hypothetical protein